jgi:hypothetical protein
MSDKIQTDYRDQLVAIDALVNAMLRQREIVTDAAITYAHICFSYLGDPERDPGKAEESMSAWRKFTQAVRDLDALKGEAP